MQYIKNMWILCTVTNDIAGKKGAVTRAVTRADALNRSFTVYLMLFKHIFCNRLTVLNFKYLLSSIHKLQWLHPSYSVVCVNYGKLYIAYILF